MFVKPRNIYELPLRAVETVYKSINSRLVSLFEVSSQTAFDKSNNIPIENIPSTNINQGDLTNVMHIAHKLITVH